MALVAAAQETQFHVLAVDDSLIDRKLIEKLLKTSSYQVTAVDSGSKALEFLGLQDDQRDPPVVSHTQEIEVNLIITDYWMPGMTGYDLLKKIKESSSLKDIPVVIMSSENVPSRISRFLVIGSEFDGISPFRSMQEFLNISNGTQFNCGGTQKIEPDWARYRCLEEGAEEFFLKPVQLSDMKRLQPHLVKGKAKEQQQQQQKLESNNKRKAIDEGIPTKGRSQRCRRQSCSGL